jgi:hypothetical protein
MPISNYVYGPLICIALSALYVCLIYCIRICPFRVRSRNDPIEIITRSVAVSVSALLSLFIGEIFIGNSIFNLFANFNLIDLFVTIIQTLLLMSGSIYHHHINGDHMTRSRSLGKLQLVRNLVIAPITEEIVFRSVFSKILIFFEFSYLNASVIAPILFMLAHSHHYYGHRLEEVLVDIGHTCLFGWISFYFLKRSLVDSIVAHSICNLIGLPGEISSPRLFILAFAFFLVSIVVVG